MKKNILYIFKVIVILVLSTQQYVLAQGSWEWQNPLPQGANMNALIPLSPTRAIFTGFCGTIMTTEDGGQNWHIQRLTKIVNVFEYSFISENEGWIIANWMDLAELKNEIRIFKTTNGGMDWQDLDISIDINISIYDLNDIEFVNNRVGYLLATSKSVNSEEPDSYSGLIYKTEDGGLNWTQIDSWASERLYQVTFTDSLNGFLLSQPNSAMTTNLHTTNDGGNTWEALPDSGYGNVHFVSSRVAWAGNFKTTDGGETWKYQEFNFPDLENSIDKIYFADSLTGYAINYKTILKTNDGGNSWSIQKEIDRSSINDIKFYNKDIGWVCGSSGTIFKTIDGGENWIGLKKEVIANLYDVDFADSETGCAVGDNGSILHTDNGGITWEVQESNVDEFIKAIDFVNKNDGWAVGGDYILSTNNGGKEWKISRPFDLGDGSLIDVTFLDENTGFIVGNSYSLEGSIIIRKGVIFKTVDGGQTWQQNTGYPILSAISFIDKQYGWICGINTVLATQDGGLSWEEQNFQGSCFLSSIQFVDCNHGWALSDNASKFFRTIDGGITWQEVPCDNYQIMGMHRFFFTDQNTGWASLYFVGDIIKTTDGGQTWEFQDRLPVYRVKSLFFINNGLGWAVSSDGAILQYKDVSTSTINPVLPSSPDICVLNYPNPFNPVTTIAYNISIESNIKLEIFDINGCLIETLINNKHTPPGSYTVSWNASRHASGVYFYKIQAGNFQQIHKCLLLK